MNRLFKHAQVQGIMGFHLNDVSLAKLHITKLYVL